MTGFQNSMRKNSWQKPKSLYEMDGYGVGGDSNLDAFNRRDAELQPARDANEEGLKAIRADLKDIAAKAHKEFVDNDGTGHHGIGKAEATDILRDHPSFNSLSDSGRDDIWRDLVSHIDDIHAAHMADQEADGRDWYNDRGMTHGDPHNPLREAVIQMNEVKANIRREYPFTIHGPDQDPTSDPSGASMDKRSTIRYAAQAALNDQNHWIYDPKHHNIRRALFNFTSENTQKEDLPHIVTFMKMDPKFKKDLAELDADIEKYGHF